MEQEFDCMPCSDPQCLRIMDTDNVETFRPYFWKLMQDLYFLENFEELDIKAMHPCDRELALNFTVQDCEKLMMTVLRYFSQNRGKK